MLNFLSIWAHFGVQLAKTNYENSTFKVKYIQKSPFSTFAEILILYPGQCGIHVSLEQGLAFEQGRHIIWGAL